MKTRQLRLLGLAWISLASSAVPQSPNAGQIERTARQLTRVLLDQDFEVNRGSVKLWTADDCPFTFTRIGLCLGNNPAAPYVVATAPPWPDEATIPNMSVLWGASPPKYEDVFRLDPREALILLVQMPPPARFFSEQSWMFSRQDTFDTTSETYVHMKDLTEEGVLPDFAMTLFFRKLPLPEGVPERIIVGAALSNPINNAVIDNQAGTSFGQQRYFIVTPDEYLNTAVRNAFREIGIPKDAIFTEQIPSNLRVGLDLSADDFLTWFRYAQPNDGGGPGTASAKWRKNLPIAVLRVRHTGHQSQPYPAFGTEQLEARTAYDESVFKPDLYRLISAVGSKWDIHCTKTDCSDEAISFVDLQTDPIWMVGTRCEPIGENCLLDNWDTSYQIFGRATVDNGEIYAVAGTLGTRTGNATYVGLSVNKASQFVGIGNLSDDLLADTAGAYSADVPGNLCPAANHAKTSDCLFLYYFARDCSVVQSFTGEKNCFEVDEKMVPQGDSIVFAVRDYLRPGTLRGPDSSQVLNPILLRVH